MFVRGILVGVFGAFAFAAASNAHAQVVTVAAPLNVAPNQAQPWTLQGQQKTLQYQPKGRWSLKLDMQQPVGRDMQWKDVDAGAYFRLSPQLKIGGSVGVGNKYLQQAPKIAPEDNNPRVHLETLFQF